MNNKGFTLVELSVVLVITGLIIFGIISGQAIMKNAVLKSIVFDVSNFRTAYNSYVSYYRALPGDHKNAYDYFDGSGGKDICGKDSAGKKESCNGDGDGKIEFANGWGGRINYEDLRAWQHLSLAKMIPGDYTGELDGKALTPGVNVPSSKIKDAGYWLTTFDTIYGRIDNYIEFGSTDDNVLNGPVISPRDARAIDTKIDDGLAGSGDVMTSNARVNMVELTGCTSKDTFEAPPSDYILSSKNILCKMFFFFDLKEGGLTRGLPP